MNDALLLRAAIERFTPFPDVEWAFFHEHLHAQEFKKEEYLCTEGEVEHYIYFIRSGLARAYFLKEGREYTLDFFFAHDFATAFTSFLEQRPAAIYLQALENTLTWKIHHDDLHKLYHSSAAAERIGRVIAEQQFMRRSRKELAWLSLTARERYLRLLASHQDMVSRISVKHLSSYLGIHPESLSRIRRQVTR
ncbi:cAMP-binding domain of CRP or a regulatory subunit of cAMP-dependent protein kinases [Chitinophaga costaii]|uniref:cAMP-binding domain of CRP or a regulatory subunit of cAMP-dependent protein kinases n=1 Tax=Chitinophaga costaii TaxID=1335309 RepID=A0A1C4FMI0_9BACT|nr:Crp/Fnr family transcriptional regulator [Chitinophaga costaii]PUZ29945.1 Crp/Fnr family transcriptional regulator [Chitinophaga costaii]SCC57034.1 cAMP-binding domain of CRP or a regulatory subunit of cAMP-dependent protein kinases [Chitinophaga costaii]